MKSSYENIFRIIQIGQGEGDGTETFTKEQVAEQISAATAKALEDAKKSFETEAAGLKNKNKELLDTLSSATEKLKKVDGIDIESLLKLKQTVENDEILKLASEGKHSEAIDKATEKLRATHTSELEALQTKLAETIEGSSKDKMLIDKLMIEDGSKMAFLNAKGLPEGVVDVALRARQVWKVEDGELVARDEKGELIRGEKGPLTLAEWTESLKTTAPHLFPASESAGAKGGKGGKVDLSTIDQQMVDASKKGDIKELRRLRAEKAKSSK